LVGLEAGDAAGTSGKINQTSVMVNRSLRDLRTHGTTGIGGGILNLMKVINNLSQRMINKF